MRFTWILLLSFLLTGCMIPPLLHAPRKQPPDMIMKKSPRVALVLGGGGAKGYAHLGVLKVLEEEHIPVDLIVGASAGALVGALYADQGSIQQATQTLRGAGYFNFVDITLFPPLQAPVTGNALQWFLKRHMHASNFSELKIPLVVMATDLRNGEPVAISSGPIPPAVAASSAIPGVFRPVKLYGRTLIDGAMVSPVPVEAARSYHPTIVIAVNLDCRLPRLMPHNFLGEYTRAFAINWCRLSTLSANGADVVIHPHVGQVGTFDMSFKYQLFMSGVRAAKEAMPAIKKAMSDHHIKYIE